jgi:hypothetical protein
VIPRAQQRAHFLCVASASVPVWAMRLDDAKWALSVVVSLCVTFASLHIFRAIERTNPMKDPQDNSSARPGSRVSVPVPNNEPVLVDPASPVLPSAWPRIEQANGTFNGLGVTPPPVTMRRGGA